MSDLSPRALAMEQTRRRILDVALETLGRDPDAGMAEVAAAAAVVRRTVYGYFPTRADLVRTLARQAVDEMSAVLAEVDASAGSPDVAWVDFVSRLWPLAHRYRVLIALRRGEFGHEIHALLEPVDASLAALVLRGQDDGSFSRHLPSRVLSQIAFSSVFSVADAGLDDARAGVAAAVVTSLLVLGVPHARARDLAAATA